MELRELLRGAGIRDNVPEGVEIRGLTCVSGECVPGALFFALRGAHRDGADFLADAFARGAAAAVAESGGAAFPGGIVVRVADGRAAMALCAGLFHGRPGDRMTVAGITGTSGKTTTAYLLDGILKGPGGASTVLGTIRHLVAGRARPSDNTTPESYFLQACLREALDAGSRHAVLEVSSHALKLKRVHGMAFDAAIFTNLTRDHMDFHPTVEDYLETKLILFEQLLKPDGVAILNADDPTSARVRSRTRSRVLTFSLENEEADLFPRKIENRIDGMSLVLKTPGGDLALSTKLKGGFNVQNIMAAAAAGLGLGRSAADVKAGIEGVTAVDGRFESVDAGQPFHVIVDYAHKPDALEKVLTAARRITEGRLILVFGCGGDRDRGKRPLMASISDRLADFTVITSDNPRTEQPSAIIADILAPLTDATRFCVVEDRAAAIREALGLARAGDTVVIAGKGHEDYQIIGKTKIHFDDREVARNTLTEKYGTPAR